MELVFRLGEACIIICASSDNFFCLYSYIVKLQFVFHLTGDELFSQVGNPCLAQALQIWTGCILGWHWLPIGKVINSVFAVKDTNSKRQIVRWEKLLFCPLYVRKTFFLFMAYSKRHTDLFSSQIDFLIFMVKVSASHYKVSGKL